MTRTTLMQIIEDQIQEIVKYKKEKSSQLSVDEFDTLHRRLEDWVTTYNDLLKP